MPNKLSLYNGALLLMGERALSALDEDNESRHALDDAWDVGNGAIDACLQLGLWNFAARAVRLDASPDVTPAFGYRYGFDRPSDWVRTMGVCEDEYFRQPLLDYMDEAQWWWSDLDPIYVRYVSNAETYGADYSLWPPNFTGLVEAYLARQALPRITHSTDVERRVMNAYEERRRSALSTDAMESPAQMLPEGRWSAVRRRRGAGYDRGRRNRLIG